MGLQAQSYPDLPQNIPWDGTRVSLNDVEAAYNFARSEENMLLSTTIPAITFPGENEWNLKSANEKVLWIMNRERIDRGMMPFEGADQRVISVAQSYAQFLVQNDVFGHGADGLTSWDRLDLHPDILGCRDFNWENLGNRWSSAGPVQFPIEAILYEMYYDDDHASWAHRQGNLRFYDNNSGDPGSEGVIGVGIVHTTNFQGSFSEPKNFVTILVLEILDPCSSWSIQTSLRPLTPPIQMIMAYPNPANNLLIIDNGNIGLMADYSIRIINSSGQQLFTSPINTQEITVDLTHFGPTGLYFLQFIDPFSKVVSVRKLMLQ